MLKLLFILLWSSILFSLVLIYASFLLNAVNEHRARTLFINKSITDISMSRISRIQSGYDLEQTESLQGLNA